MLSMTTVEVLYRYGAHPTEDATAALGKLREVYGIRRTQFNQTAQTVRIEYDATRLNEPAVQQMLRRAGLDVVELLPLIPPQPAPESAAAPVA